MKKMIAVGVGICLLTIAMVSSREIRLDQEYIKISEAKERNSILSVETLHIDKKLTRQSKTIDTINGMTANKKVQEVKQVSATEERDVIVAQNKTVSNEYFSDSAFLGDSRTKGLFLNTGLTNATFYADTGLGVDTAMTKKFISVEGSKKKITILKALKQQSFGKIYIMFGINELGWNYPEIFISKYKELITAIQKEQPEATIYIQSILPVTAKKSDSDKIVNNKRISQYNELIKKMTVDLKVNYVNVAEAVETKYGNLNREASTDGVHLNKSYCNIWLEYLKTHTVK